MELSGAVIAKAVLCVGLSAGTALLTMLLGRGSRSNLGLATAVAASAFSGASLAVLLGVMGIIRSFRAMAMSGSGGIASVSAGIWEAVQSLRFAAYAATVIGIAAIVLVTVRRAFDESSEETASVSTGRIVKLILLFVGVCGVMMLSWIGMTGVTDLVLNVMNPNYKPDRGIAEVSTEISRRLMLTSATAGIGLLLMLATIPIALVIGRAVPASQGVDRIATLQIIVAITLAVVLSYQLTTLGTRLYQIALTGSVS